jgi:hypothetical protein
MANAQAVERILLQGANATISDLTSTFAVTFPGQDTFAAACHLYMLYNQAEQSATISDPAMAEAVSNSHVNGYLPYT